MELETEEDALAPGYGGAEALYVAELELHLRADGKWDAGLPPARLSRRRGLDSGTHGVRLNEGGNGYHVVPGSGPG